MTKAEAPSLAPLALSLHLEFDRPGLPAGGEAFARLVVSVPQAAHASGGPRRGLALAVALDTSGSMDGPAGVPDGSPMAFSIPRLGMSSHASSGGPNCKMERCKVAVWEAVSLLGDEDMASLTAFSSMARTLFPMAPMTEANKTKFKKVLDKLLADGGTALQAGWAEAGKEAAKGIDRKLLCRVALFTDGEASTGERDPEALSAQSAKLAELGVSTSCFGVGASFNEDLLCAMADAGEGNFRYIPDAMLAAAAATDEVNGLGAAAGRKAKLRIVAQEGIDSVEMLNAFATAGDGWLRLPTLMAGRPIEAVVKVKVKVSSAIGSARILAELSWEDRDGIEQRAERELSAPVLDSASALLAPQNPEVAGSAAALMAAAAKDEMTRMISKGDIRGATAKLDDARTMLCSTAVYSGLGAEMESLNMLSASMSSGNMAETRKMAKFQSYSRSTNQTVSGAAAPAADPKTTPSDAP